MNRVLSTQRKRIKKRSLGRSDIQVACGCWIFI